MIISGIVKSSMLDFPGQVACVLFVPGCNFDCYYCHNRALIDGVSPVLSFDDIFGFLEKRRGLLGGVVISGGEPTLQEGLGAFMGEVKKLGFKLKLDTNGSRPDVVEQLLKAGLVDYFAVDYKAPAARYPELCRGEADAGKTLETIALLLRYGADFEVRTTVAPELGEADLLQMARELPPLPRYTLNRYRRPELFLPSDEALIEAQPYAPARIRAFAEAVRPLQPNVSA